jgi:amino acid transporter
MKKLKKGYHLIFYKLFQFFESVSKDGWEDWKAYIVVNSMCLLVFVEGLVWYSVIMKRAVEISKSYAIPLSIAITLVNYFVLMHKNKWKEYEYEFMHYNRSKNRLANLFVFFCVLGVLSSFILAFYQLSIIDWAKYNPNYRG